MTYNEYINSIIEARGQWSSDVRYSEHGCERHHIKPKSWGGEPIALDWNKHANVIWLYPREHYIAHRLLYLENPTDYGLFAAWRGTTKNNTISEEDYEELKKYSHNFPQELLDKIEAAGEFRYKIRKELPKPVIPHKIKDLTAFRAQKSKANAGKGNPMYGNGHKVAGGNNGHASIRYFYENKTFECRKDLLKYLNDQNISVTSSAIRAVIHNRGTLRVYNMYKEVFDKLSWEYK